MTFVLILEILLCRRASVDRCMILEWVQVMNSVPRQHRIVTVTKNSNITRYHLRRLLVSPNVLNLTLLQLLESAINATAAHQNVETNVAAVEEVGNKPTTTHPNVATSEKLSEIFTTRRFPVSPGSVFHRKQLDV